MGGKRSSSNDEEVKENISAEPANLIENASVKVEKIEDLTPAQDFVALIFDKDSSDWVVKAINEMKSKIFDLVEDPHKGDNYPKALEYLLLLRKSCILEQVIIYLIHASKRWLGFSLFNPLFVITP